GMSGPGFGLIGTGFMGRAHAIALHEVAVVFDDIARPRAVCVSDRDDERAGRAAAELRFERATGDWRSLLKDPAIDVLDICTPNHLHFEMARAALAAGKHVYCEKPLALDVREAATLAAAARESGAVHGLGLNYTANPMAQVARELIAAGEIGDVVHFTGRYFEDYMADRDGPFTWRCERALAGAGALADLGSHLVNMLHFLVGRPQRVLGEVHIAIPERRDPATGALRRVENEDIARALIELESGVPATLEISRVATGRKCGLTFEVYGTRGSIAFDQERMNELKLYGAGQAAARAGYQTILAGPAHGDYARFCPSPGHGLGINDLKVIELHNFIRAVECGEGFYPDFDEGLAVQRVMAAIETSGAERAWVDVEH
ncbi:MAG TPA: Gfo/Idh/MocA family oxidoreductase, partial [Woeseiaceae bacterium]|nr:Gfo/Idh/MocA family oxidoreductase [Woeseiaceae bacterium]